MSQQDTDHKKKPIHGQQSRENKRTWVLDEIIEPQDESPLEHDLPLNFPLS